MTCHSDITLEFEDVLLSIKHAELRRYEAICAGLKDRFYGSHLSDVEILKREAAGVCAEIAVAKWLGLKLALRLNSFHNEADIGHDIEVRSILNPQRGLALRKNDNMTRRFILVHVGRCKAKLLGWIYGYEGMEPEYLSNPYGKGEVWYVPQGRLYEMNTFER